MTAKNYDRTLLVLAIIVGLLVLGIFGIAYGDNHRYSDDDVDIDITGGDVNVPVDVSVTGGAVDVAGDTLNLSTGGNRAYALAAPPLGDVDIAQCLGSEAWTLLIGGKQVLVINWPCMAEFYLKQGRYDLAAQALCNHPEIVADYETEVACQIDHDFTPPIIEGEDKYEHDVHIRSDEFEEAYAITQQQEEEIEYLQEENASIVGRLDVLTARLEQASEPRPAPVQQEQQPEYTDDKFNEVWAILQGSKEEEDE